MINLGVDNAQNLDLAADENSSNQYKALRFTKAYIDLITKGPAHFPSRVSKCASIAARVTVLFSLFIALIPLFIDLLLAISHRFYGEKRVVMPPPAPSATSLPPSEVKSALDEQIITPATSPVKAATILVKQSQEVSPSFSSPAPNDFTRLDLFTPGPFSTPGNVRGGAPLGPSVSSALKLSPFEENEQLQDPPVVIRRLESGSSMQAGASAPIAEDDFPDLPITPPAEDLAMPDGHPQLRIAQLELERLTALLAKIESRVNQMLSGYDAPGRKKPSGSSPHKERTDVNGSKMEASLRTARNSHSKRSASGPYNSTITGVADFTSIY